jgi:hypothetical protein
MNIINIHKRILNQPKEKVSKLLATLSTDNDKIWPFEKWPAMKFKAGLKVGAKGGHGPIRYSIEKYIPNELIQFKFSKPTGFNGIHKFEVLSLDKGKTELRHTIEMDAEGKGLSTWIIAIRSLHNALLEDALDKVENQFSSIKRKTEWSIWVKILRKILKPKKAQNIA